MAKLRFKLGFPYWQLLLPTTISQKLSEIPYSHENDIKMDLYASNLQLSPPPPGHLQIPWTWGLHWTVRYISSIPSNGTHFPWLSKESWGYWPSLSGDVLGAFPTQACSMSAQSRTQPFSSDLPQGLPKTYGDLRDGKGLHHSRENDVKGNTCLPRLW